MPRVLTATLTAAKNQVQSTDPFCWLFMINGTNFPGPLRFVSDVDSLVYQGNTYVPFPVDISSVGENTVGERQTMQGVVCNVDQMVINFLNDYWDAVLDPLWEVHLWQVLRSAPNEVPASDATVYEVMSAETDLLQVTFELEASGIPTKQQSTGRRFTTSGGFPHLPRVGRLF